MRRPVYCPPYVPMVDVLPEGTCGAWRVQHFELDAKRVVDERVRAAMDGRLAFREVMDLEPGRYAGLFAKGESLPMMSDTPMERRTCLAAVEEARGRVFMGGLGIGMMLVPILAKRTVDHVLVVEAEPDIVRLVEPALREVRGGRKLEVVVGDVYDWRPTCKWTTVWLDIWPDVSLDNWDQMKMLRRLWTPWVEDDGWLGMWRYEDVQYVASRRR